MTTLNKNMPTYRDAELAKAAWDVLKANDRGRYTLPSPKLFPFQWNWDSPLVAMAISLVDEDRAFQEIEILLESQWASGMVPHIIYHVPSDGYFPGPEVWGCGGVPPTSAISQPPILATCLLYIIENSKDQAEALRRADPILTKLTNWHRWWHTQRDPEGSGLVSIIHPWESGRDNSVDWDSPLSAVEMKYDASSLRKDRHHVQDDAERPTDDFYNRILTLIKFGKSVGWDDLKMITESPFRVCDVGVQSILIRADEDLSTLLKLAGREGRETEEIDSWMTRSKAAMGRLWHAKSGSFRALDLIKNELVPSVSAATFLPMYAGCATDAQVKCLSKVFEKAMSECKFSVPQTMPDTPGFDPKNYSRGPSWPFFNRIVADGFKRYGLTNLSDRLREDTHAMISAQGFREYYHPSTGEGLGGEQFAWTAAAWLIWAGTPAGGATTGVSI